MSQTALFEERVLFSPNLPDAVNRLLQHAVTAINAWGQQNNIKTEAKLLDIPH